MKTKLNQSPQEILAEVDQTVKDVKGSYYSQADKENALFSLGVNISFGVVANSRPEEFSRLNKYLRIVR